MRNKSAMLHFLIIGFLGFIVPNVAHSDAVLYTSECPVVGGECNSSYRDIHAYTFNKGELISSDFIVGFQDVVFHHFYDHEIHENRFLVSGSGVVVDLKTNTTVRDGRGDLRAIDGMKVIYELRYTDIRGFFEFDLDSHAFNRVPETSMWPLSGVLSPDLTKKLSTNRDFPVFYVNSRKIILHTLREKSDIWLLNNIYNFYEWLVPHQIASDLHVTSEKELGGRLPFVWIDNERILTQKENGELVIVGIDASLTPLVKIPAEILPHAFLSPKLYRDPEGTFIYSIFRDKFEIDVEKGTYNPTKWESLGHGFEIEIEKGFSEKRKVSYLGKEIGEYQIPENHNIKATKGYIAIAFRKEGLPMGHEYSHLAVWSAHTQEWTEKEIGSLSTFIGWIDNFETE